jgi:two-component system NtrC family sensor kinase
MDALGTLAARLAETTDVPSAADLLAEHARRLVPQSGARVWLVAPGDLCATCMRARTCAARDRCLHLAADQGRFDLPPGHVERIPLADPGFAPAVAGRESTALPPEMAGVGGEAEGLLLPLVAGGERLGVLGLRAPSIPPAAGDALRVAACLAGSSMRALAGLQTDDRRLRQILLVNDLGRKVTSILNDDLLLRQAAIDIQRSFGFHNVMIFMRDGDPDRLALRAHASASGARPPPEGSVPIDRGVVGRACRRKATEVVADVARDSDFLPWWSDTRSEIAVPIQIGGAVEGVLNVESDRVDGFGESDRLVLETVANQMAIAIENARLFGMVKEREDRYRLLLESNPGAVFHLDETGRVTFTNTAASHLTGQGKTALAERLRTFSDLAVPEHRATLEQALGDALRGVARHDLDVRVQHADGHPRHVKAAFQPLVGEDGVPRGVVVLAIDQSREQELQAQLRQSERLSAIGSLVSGVAHELNNPLAGILGFSQLLLAKPPEEWTRQDVQKIERNAQRCQQIVENLLAFGRQARLRKKPADLNEVIDGVVRLNEYQFRMDDVAIERDLDLRVPKIPLDVPRWQQVFVNLAANAHQALVGSARTKGRKVRFETRRRGDEIVIRVSDNGPGIPAHLRARVFEPFFTTKETGTGLGLGICFGIVADHGGRIELAPDHGEGACFVITVPIPGESGAAPAAAPSAPAAASRDGRGRRALVVDDEAAVCEVVGGTLANHQYEVDMVADAEAALARIRERPYDVILTDLFMPGEMNGLGLFDVLSEERPALARRVIFLTGSTLSDQVADRIAGLGIRCIEKPFDIHELARTVNEVASAGARDGDA